MDFNELNAAVEEFNSKTHGSSDYHKETYFLRHSESNKFSPVVYLKKKISWATDVKVFLEAGYILNSFDLFEQSIFSEWFEKQFGRKFTKEYSRSVVLLELPNNKMVGEVISTVHRSFEALRKESVLLNGKNLPTQLGEWNAKCIFGLNQMKSSSQRGFDFFLDKERVEVKVHWADQSSPKGVKIRKSLVDLSDYCIIIYLAKNFLIRELCFLDSDFVRRKFSGKGHTMFLKDQDVSQYFFSNSSKQRERVVNSTALLKYSTPTLAMKLAEWYQSADR